MKLSHYRDSYFINDGLSGHDTAFLIINNIRPLRLSNRYVAKLSYVPPKRSVNCLHRQWNRLGRITLNRVYKCHTSLSTFATRTAEINEDEE